MRLEDEGNNTNGTSRPFSNGSGASMLHKAAIANSANGTRASAVAMNGSSTTNGHSGQGGKPRPSYFGHDREEVTRILIQALTDLGYYSAATNLSEESGYDLESPVVAAFRHAVLDGAWNDAEELLFGGSTEEGGVSVNGNGLVLQEGIDKNIMKFWLRQQKFLELLELRDTGRALMVLRLELAPLYADTGKLHFLSSLLMCQSTEDLKAKAEWDGAGGASRHQLLSELSKCISPSVMLPEHRLSILLDQVKRNQISNCLYHNTAASPSLYQNHTCDRNNFPVYHALDLESHSGEVWNVLFSHDGRSFATCGGDGTCILYDAQTLRVLHHLAPNETGGMSTMAWSPDDSMIVTVGNVQAANKRNLALLWNTDSGNLKHQLPIFKEPVTSVVWAPDGQSFLTGCLEKTQSLCQWNLDGELIYDWRQTDLRIGDLAISPNGRYLVVAIGGKQNFFVFNFITRELEYELEMDAPIASISIGQVPNELLVNKTNGDARIIDLETRETVHIYQSGVKGGNFVVRSSYGGANESFVVIGSEDGHIYIWHRETGQLIEKLEHGKGSCNAISWSSQRPNMFVSVGDDCKVKVWADSYSTFRKPSPQSTNGSQPPLQPPTHSNSRGPPSSSHRGANM